MSQPPPPPPPDPVPYAQPAPQIQEAESKKLAAGIIAIFLGAFGVHKFILGYNTAGIIMLVCSITCVGYPVMHIIGIVEGIIYLTKNNEQFYQTYMLNRKEWF